MGAREITLNIAVNLGRLARWAMEGCQARAEQLLDKTEDFLVALDKAPKSDRFLPTFQWFKEDFNQLRNEPSRNSDWAEALLTWANILTHRAKLI